MPWLGLALAAVGVLLAIPASRDFLLRLLDRGPQHNGRTTGEWMARLKDPGTRTEAIEALGMIGAQAPGAVDSLARSMLEDPDPANRIAASRALYRMSPASARVSDSILAAMRDSEHWVRLNATLALVRMGSAANPPLDALFDCMKDPKNREPTPGFHVTIEERLAGLVARLTAGTDRAVAPVSDCLGRCDRVIGQVMLVQALGAIGPPAKPSLVRLAELGTKARGTLAQEIRDATAAINGAK